MSFPIAAISSQGPTGPQRAHQPSPAGQAFQQMLQQLPQTPQQPQVQGTGQDAMVSFSPEAMESLSTPGSGQGGGANPGQLEQQIQSGDLESALSTIEQMEAQHPSQGNDPNQELKTQLKEQLEQGDQAGAQQILEQIKAHRPV